MKKESNMGLLFLMAVGIVGLGLYYGATDNYGSGEILLGSTDNCSAAGAGAGVGAGEVFLGSGLGKGTGKP